VTFQADTNTWLDGVGPGLGLTIYIRGEINPDAAILVRRYYDGLVEMSRRFHGQMNAKDSDAAVNVHLDSEGGSVDSAIEIGRFLRDKNSNVMVSAGEQCASACLFILAGGVTRYLGGRLGMHRPFLETPSRSMTTEDVKKAATLNQERLRAYFREMNISERLADDMMMIPSNQMRWLSPQEIAVYGLGVNDPVVSETKTLKQAQKYGLSRLEYERRWQLARGLCELGTADDCIDKVMTGKYTGKGWGPPITVKAR